MKSGGEFRKSDHESKNSRFLSRRQRLQPPKIQDKSYCGSSYSSLTCFWMAWRTGLIFAITCSASPRPHTPSSSQSPPLQLPLPDCASAISFQRSEFNFPLPHSCPSSHSWSQSFYPQSFYQSHSFNILPLCGHPTSAVSLNPTFPTHSWFPFFLPPIFLPVSVLQRPTPRIHSPICRIA